MIIQSKEEYAQYTYHVKLIFQLPSTPLKKKQGLNILLLNDHNKITIRVL